MRDKKFLVPKLELGNQKNRWLSGAEAGKIASTPLSERLNLMTLEQTGVFYALGRYDKLLTKH